MAYNRDANHEVDDEKMSKINAAGIINITIENLWRDSYSAMAAGKLSLWNFKLDAVWAILGGDVKENGPEEKAFDKLEEKLFETGSLNHKNIGFESADVDQSLIKAKQYLLLRKKSLFLRRLQNSQGKGTAYDSGDEGDWE